MTYKFHVRYVEDCIPKAKSFNTEKQAQDFCLKFLRDTAINDGYWIDYIWKGEYVRFFDTYWKTEPSRKARSK